VNGGEGSVENSLLGPADARRRRGRARR